MNPNNQQHFFDLFILIDLLLILSVLLILCEKQCLYPNFAVNLQNLFKLNDYTT